MEAALEAPLEATEVIATAVPHLSAQDHTVVALVDMEDHREVTAQEDMEVASAVLVVTALVVMEAALEVPEATVQEATEVETVTAVLHPSAQDLMVVVVAVVEAAIALQAVDHTALEALLAGQLLDKEAMEVTRMQDSFREDLAITEAAATVAPAAMVQVVTAIPA
uniref:Uncharacterized protein n=1 Tax=Cacopsylla melanoneura TaxID=428564 RepID=A0A8D8Y5Y6_9HEMI